MMQGNYTISPDGSRIATTEDSQSGLSGLIEDMFRTRWQWEQEARKRADDAAKLAAKANRPPILMASGGGGGGGRSRTRTSPRPERGPMMRQGFREVRPHVQYVATRPGIIGGILPNDPFDPRSPRPAETKSNPLADERAEREREDRDREDWEAWLRRSTAVDPRILGSGAGNKDSGLSALA